MATFGQSQEFSRIVNSTTAEFVRKEMVNIFRKRRFLALLREKGKITGGHEGDEVKWPVRYKRAPMVTITDTPDLDHARRNKRKTAVLPWRGYAATDAITTKERLMNKGNAAIVKLFKNMTSELLDDIKDNFAEELYVDGNAAGNTERIHGTESWFSAADASAKAATSNDSYAGLNCTLGTYGGSWTGTWPEGSGDAHYDFWTPLVLDYADSNWAAATDNWKNNAIEVLRYGIIHTQRNATMVDLILLTSALYADFLDELDARERIVTERAANNSILIKLGFGNVVNFDGADVTWEVGVPAGVGYGLATESLELKYLGDQLFQPIPVDFNVSGLSHRHTVISYCNLCANPRDTFKVASV